jgi:hypothetical protein
MSSQLRYFGPFQLDPETTCRWRDIGINSPAHALGGMNAASEALGIDGICGASA